MEHYRVIVPLQLTSDLLSILYPLDWYTWYAILASMPVFIVVMWLLGYISNNGKVKWEPAVDFVVRTVCSENGKHIPDEKPHEKALVLFWQLAYFVIVASYAGALTAMITKPTLELPIRNIDQLLGQSEIPWVVEDGIGVQGYMSSSPEGSTMKRLVDGATLLPLPQLWGCYNDGIEYTHAAICDQFSIKTIYHGDYSRTGKCNFYLTDDQWHNSMLVMAFQVSRKKKI